MSIRSQVRRLVNDWDAAFAFRQKIDMWAALAGHYVGHERSWSQFGEDEILCRELAPVLRTGFYMDIGANHPARLSNTYRLYCRGMRGITVEPSRVLSSLHEQFRPEDVHLCAGAGEEDGVLEFYRMVPHAMSTFSASQAEKYLTEGCRLRSRSLVPVLSIRTILECCPLRERPIFALLSVDTEALDEPVLRGNDWSRFRPMLVIVENLEHGGSVRDMLVAQGYELIASPGHNEIYRVIR